MRLFVFTTSLIRNSYNYTFCFTKSNVNSKGQNNFVDRAIQLVSVEKVFPIHGIITLFIVMMYNFIKFTTMHQSYTYELWNLLRAPSSFLFVVLLITSWSFHPTLVGFFVTRSCRWVEAYSFVFANVMHVYNLQTKVSFDNYLSYLKWTWKQQWS